MDSSAGDGADQWKTRSVYSVLSYFDPSTTGWHVDSSAGFIIYWALFCRRHAAEHLLVHYKLYIIIHTTLDIWCDSTIDDQPQSHWQRWQDSRHVCHCKGGSTNKPQSKGATVSRDEVWHWPWFRHSHHSGKSDVLLKTEIIGVIALKYFFLLSGYWCFFDPFG